MKTIQQQTSQRDILWNLFGFRRGCSKGLGEIMRRSAYYVCTFIFWSEQQDKPE